jgi:hypothetical protein
MKAYSEIQQQIEFLSIKIRGTSVDHERLSQIDMLSGEGNILREKINKMKGMKKALDWVVNDYINGDLYDME